MNRVRIKLENVRVTWVGSFKNKTTGKENPAVQGVIVTEDGREESFYMSGEVGGIKAGERVDAVVDLKAFKDSFFVNLVSHSAVGSVAEKKAVRV